MITYDIIKKAAKESGISASELLALSPANDPYAVDTPRARKMANWFKHQVWDAAGYTSGVHLRRAHYWAVSKEIKLPQEITQEVSRNGRPTKIKSSDYLNTLEAWQYLCKASMYARYFGLVDLDAIVDNKNPDPTIYAEYSYYQDYSVGYRVWIDDLERPYIIPEIAKSSDLQPYHLEIWCEKSTMNDVLLPIAERFRAVLCTFQGEASLTACNDFVDRVEKANKPARIIYISDFDAAGISMPKAVARKVEWILDERGYELNVAVRQASLTLEQVRRYNLPTTPMKPKERRADSFMERTGVDGAVELDALEALMPGELDRIITEILGDYFSDEAEEWNRTTKRTIQRRVFAEVEKVNADFADMLEKFKEYREAIANIEIETDDLVVEEDEFRFEADEFIDDFLYWSFRSYADQIAAYKRYNHEEPAFDEQSMQYALEDAYYG